MKKSYVNRLLGGTLAAALALGASACDVQESGYPDSDFKEAAITNGSSPVITSALGRIMIDLGDGVEGSCSGTFVGRSMFMTAAHCFNKRRGAFRFSVAIVQNSFQSGSHVDTCRTANVTGLAACSGAKIRARVELLGNGFDAVKGDFALVYPEDGATTWPVASSAASAEGLFTGSQAVGAAMTFYGYETNIPQYLSETVTRWGGSGDADLEFTGKDTSENPNGAVCHGDSGGPYMFGSDRSRTWAMGVLSRASGPDHCLKKNTDLARKVDIDFVNLTRSRQGFAECKQVAGFPDFWRCD